MYEFIHARFVKHSSSIANFVVVIILLMSLLPTGSFHYTHRSLPLQGSILDHAHTVTYTQTHLVAIILQFKYNSHSFPLSRSIVFITHIHTRTQISSVLNPILHSEHAKSLFITHTNVHTHTHRYTRISCALGIPFYILNTPNLFSLHTPTYIQRPHEYQAS
jgi:hypothetical protein